MSPVFFWSDAMAVAIAWGQNKQAAEYNKNKKQASTQATKQSNRQCRLFFCFGPMQWLQPLRAAKRNN